MMAEAIIHRMMHAPTRLDVATWIAAMMEEMRGEGAMFAMPGRRRITHGSRMQRRNKKLIYY